MTLLFGHLSLSKTLKRLNLFNVASPGLNCLSHAERLKRVHLHSLELRRLYTDLFYCYKILFGLVDLQASDFFEWALCQNTRGHKFKLYKKSCSTQVSSTFLSERVVIVCGILCRQVLTSVRFTVLNVLSNLQICLRF